MIISVEDLSFLRYLSKKTNKKNMQNSINQADSVELNLDNNNNSDADFETF